MKDLSYSDLKALEQSLQEKSANLFFTVTNTDTPSDEQVNELSKVKVFLERCRNEINRRLEYFLNNQS
jgi:hypothetical protein